jgi:pimeloyl-ACP methyl ester carboxylesterase
MTAARFCDSWEAQQLYLAENGFRAIAHDRRGHGRSTQLRDGDDMDHYAAGHPLSSATDGR